MQALLSCWTCCCMQLELTVLLETALPLARSMLQAHGCTMTAAHSSESNSDRRGAHGVSGRGAGRCPVVKLPSSHTIASAAAGSLTSSVASKLATCTHVGHVKAAVASPLLDQCPQPPSTRF